MSIGQEGHLVAAITGASSGFGKEFACQLAAKGYDLFLVARRQHILEELKQKLESQYNIAVEIMSADLADMNDLQRVESKLSSISLLEFMINNAGFGGNREFPDVDIDLETRMVQVHCLATMRLCRAALLPMTKRQSGRVINVASVAGFLSGAGAADYTATKSYLITFSKSIYCDVRSKGIRVQALCPGFAKTGFHSAESMKGSTIPQKVPGFLWLSVSDVVRTSLKSIERTFPFYRVICIPSLRYKLIAFFGSESIFAPFRILFSKGTVR